MRDKSMKQVIGSLSLSSILIISGCSASAQEVFNESVPVSVKVRSTHEELIGTGKAYAGTVTPSEEIKIISKIPGKVIDMPVEVGSSVKAGQVLFKLEDKDLRNAVEKAEAAVAAAEANVEAATMAQKSAVLQAKNGVVQSKNGMVQAKGGEVQANGGVIQSKSGVIQAKNGMVQAQDGVTKAQNAMKQAENAVEDSKIILNKAEQALKDATVNRDRMKGLFEESLVSKVQLEQAETALVSAQSAYASAKIANDNAQDKVTVAQKGLEAAQKAYENAKAAYENATAGTGNASAGYDNAAQGAENAAEAYKNAQELVKAAESTAGIKASQKAAKQAQVNAKIAKDTLSDAIVLSPINGVVGMKNAEKGEMVSNQSPVLVLANFEKVKVLTYIPANEINDVQQGNQVQVKAAAFGFVTTGTVKTVSPFDEKGKGYPVEIEVPNPDFKLKAGMIADIRLIPPDAKQGILVPSKAVVHEGKKTYVFVVKGKHAKRKEVKVEKSEGSLVMVKEGLTPDDQIITNNLSLISEGTEINYSQESR